MLKSSRKGFTLIEIIVVIVILAILMAIAVPSVMSYMKEGSEAKYLAVSRAAYQNITVEISKLEGGSSDYKTIGMACKAAIEKANTSTDDNLNISRFQINYDDSSANISMRLPKIGNGYSVTRKTIPGHRLDEENLPNNETGTYKDTPQTVTYKYIKLRPYELVVRYSSGEGEHDGKLHQAHHHEHDPHFRAVAPQPPDDLVGKGHEDVVADEQQDDARQKRQQAEIFLQEGRAVPGGGLCLRGAFPLGRLAPPESKGQVGRDQGRRHHRHRQGQGSRPPGLGQHPAETGGPGVGDGPGGPSHAVIQGDVAVDALHAQRVGEGGQNLEDHQQEHIAGRLAPLPRQDQQEDRPRRHDQGQQGAPLAEGQPPGPLRHRSRQGLHQGGQDAGHPHQHPDLGVGKAPVQQVNAGEGHQHTVDCPVQALEEGIQRGGVSNTGERFHGGPPGKISGGIVIPLLPVPQGFARKKKDRMISKRL